MALSYYPNVDPMIAKILRQTETLSVTKRKELVKLLVDSLEVPVVAPQPRRLSELRGLGKELWAGIDAQEYVNQLRDEWDENLQSQQMIETSNG